MSTLAEECHQKVELCLQMAGRAASPLEKAVWQKLAEKWRQLEREEVERAEQSSSE
jgi:hypothetical protein